MKYFINRITAVFILMLATTTHADLFTFSDINQAIPDNDSRGYADVQTISGLDQTIASLRVSISLSAVSGDLAYNGDYFMTLQHADGYAVLLNRVGKTAGNELGYNDNGFDITFTLDGSDIHFYGDVIGDGTLTGSWGADGRETDPDSVLDSDDRTATISQFLNVDPNGEWTLFVADMSGSGNGQLNSWSIDVEVVPEPMVIGLIGIFGFGLLVGKRFFIVKI